MSEFTFDAWMEALADDARARCDVPQAVVEQAARATRRALGGMASRTLSERERRRAAAYFSAVVKRRVLRGAEGRRAASRAVLATVVADLRAAGRDADSIAEELERGWSHSLPADLVEEFRLRLCG